MVNLNPTGETSEYVKAFDIAAQVLISARCNGGDQFITLEYLYDTLGATTKAERTAVRWARRRCADAGLIESTGTKGVYRFAS